MDKETLSNYGWIVIAVLVLVVMIALATPFGSFVSEAVQSTTKGLFDVNKSALDSTGLINIDNQEFDVPDMNHGDTNVPAVETVTFTIDGIECYAEKDMTWETWVSSKYNTLGVYLQGESVLASNGKLIGLSFLPGLMSCKGTIVANEAYVSGAPIM